mgnify:CR=1 FL=1
MGSRSAGDLGPVAIGTGTPGERDMIGSEGCPVTTLYAIKSGIPLIGLGLLLILSVFIGLLVPGIPVPPFPVPAIFAGFGLFLIWAGLTK